MLRPVVLVRHPACFAHDTGAGHPESRDRLLGILDGVRADPALGPGVLVEVEAQPAEREELLLAHAPSHVDLVRRMSDDAARRGTIEWVDPDTAVSGASFVAASAAAGCAVTAAELVATGHARSAFALARPPGHHAGRARAAGFCLFNNVVIAARRLRTSGLADRVLVVDWDVHHGDGTQEILWDDPSTRYLSLHLSPHYPGTGAQSERGGPGGGGIRNVPLPYGTPTAEYRRRFSEALSDALDGFAPDLVLASGGFDCLAGDPLGGLLLEPEDLHAITAEILDRTRPSAAGRVVTVLEGGYVPGRMGLGAANVLRALADLPAAPALGEDAPRAPR